MFPKIFLKTNKDMPGYLMDPVSREPSASPSPEPPEVLDPTIPSQLQQLVFHRVPDIDNWYNVPAQLAVQLQRPGSVQQIFFTYLI